MRVVVAEKPSVARDIARVLGATRKHEGFLEGQGLRITWCFGHMAELEEPAHYDPAWKRWSLDTLPMVPSPFALRLRKGGEDQFAVLRRLLRDPETRDVVNACDAGREGELIFRYVAQLADCRKPVLRLWVSSLTDQSILQGWGQLSPSSAFDRLGAAARCRAESDWLVGLNATRALTVLAGSELLSVGRVQTPTLAMIVARDREIAAFVPETYHVVRATFEAPDGRFGATFFRPELAAAEGPEGPRPGPDAEADAETAHAERLPDAATANRIADLTRGRVGRVEIAERRRTKERPPLLYDLTSLQRRANQRYGLSAQRTLEVAQALYERHKLVTYPRTDSRYLSPDQVAGIPDILRGLQPIPPYALFVAPLLAALPGGTAAHPGSRVVNAAEVGDHPAIVPTGRTPGGSLDPDEKRVFDLVARRFLAVLCEDALFDLTKLVVAVDPGQEPLPEGIAPPLRFRARGRVCRQEGWRAVDPPGKSVDVDLPAVEPEDPVTAVEVESAERQTRPPRHYNDATVLRAMETAGKALDDEALARAMRGRGLGTPATRAAILQTLLDRSYVIRQGRDLRATDRGTALISAVPIDALKSAELTADWEGRLSEMADGKGVSPEQFMTDVVRHVREIVDALARAPMPELAPSTDQASLGDCPKCGKPVRARGPRYTCDGGRNCGFVVFDTVAKRAVSPRAVRQLLTEGRTPAMKGFRSKAGKDFEAGLRWDPVESRVSFWFPDRIDAPDVAPLQSERALRSDAPSRSSDSSSDSSSDKAPKGAPKGASKSGPRSAPRRSGARAPKRAPERTPVSALVDTPIREGDLCPTCRQGRVIRGRTALGCSRWREGCPFRAGDSTIEIPSSSPGEPGRGRS